MMSFKDMAFCSSDCKNQNCFRFWTDELHMAARKWWDHDPDNVPVAFMDFSAKCEDYQR